VKQRDLCIVALALLWTPAIAFVYGTRRIAWSRTNTRALCWMVQPKEPAATTASRRFRGWAWCGAVPPDMNRRPPRGPVVEAVQQASRHDLARCLLDLAREYVNFLY
jgi:hypothetical protein